MYWTAVTVVAIIVDIVLAFLFFATLSVNGLMVYIGVGLGFPTLVVVLLGWKVEPYLVVEEIHPLAVRSEPGTYHPPGRPD